MRYLLLMDAARAPTVQCMCGRWIFQLPEVRDKAFISMNFSFILQMEHLYNQTGVLGRGLLERMLLEVEEKGPRFYLSYHR